MPRSWLKHLNKEPWVFRKVADCRLKTQKKIQDEPGTPCNARKEDSSPKIEHAKGTQSQTEKAPYEQKLEQFQQQNSNNIGL